MQFESGMKKGTIEQEREGDGTTKGRRALEQAACEAEEERRVMLS